MAEIEFWRNRTSNLHSIQSQLERIEVKTIKGVLELSKSSYLEQFLKLSELIQKGSSEAQDNLKFLSALQVPCEKLAASSPAEIPYLLPDILDVIKMIWGLSRYYSTPERITSLLRKVNFLFSYP